ncbi:MAG: 50S ribosomal protein L17 [bacterium]
MHRHSYTNRKLSRKVGPRKALLRSLVTSLVLYEKIRTTTPKAKEIRPIIEKLITTAKKGDLTAIRKLNTYIYGDNAVKKLVTEIAPIYKDRNGGYTRIVSVGPRTGDNAPMSIIELVDIDKLDKKIIEKEAKTVDTTNTKKAATKAPVKKIAKKESK